MNPIIDKLAWLRITDRKLLCARSYGKITYYIPGGKREPGESDQQALMREIHEELSIQLRAETLGHAGTFRAQADGKPEGVMVQLTCYRGEYDGELAADAEIEEIAWLRHDQREQCSPVVRIVLDDLKQRDLID